MGKIRASSFAVLGCFLVVEAVVAATSSGPITAYFNQDPQVQYTEPYRKIRRHGDNLEQVVLNAIAGAKQSIVLAVQELQLPYVAKALVQKHQQGVKVRIVLENKYSFPLSQLTPEQVSKLNEHDRRRYDEFVRLVDTNRDGKMSPQEISLGDSVMILKNATVPFIDDSSDGSKGAGLMHHKFIVVDGQSLIVTSANFTTSDMHGDFISPLSRGNSNALLKIEDAKLAKAFQMEFEILWARMFGLKKPYRGPMGFSVGGNQVALQFSPTSPARGWPSSTNGLIGTWLASAKQSINMALFVFSEQTLANVLESRFNAGVAVRTLIEPDFAYQSYSELLDMFGLAMLNIKCKFETPNHPWKKVNPHAGVPRLAEGDRLHHKFAVIDDQKVLFGSHNWSLAANVNNDETFLVLNNPVIARAFNQEFSRIYAKSSLGIPRWLPDAIRQKQQECQKLAM